ncbi:MAG TPA: DUF4864 domain-containing protein [Usitatibacteraceae bacterium]
MNFSINRLASIALFTGLCFGTGAASAEAGGLIGTGMRPAQTQKQPSAPVRKLTAADRQKIQRVIILQIRAFERNDEAVAFSYATPDARRYFGTPRAFMEVVRSSYSALYRHSSHEFLEAAVIDDIVVQPLKILTTDGEIIVALYTVEQQPDREWRVGSCELAPSTLSAT